MNPSEEVRCQFSRLGQEDGPAQDAGGPAGARDPGGRLREDRSGRATRFGSSQHGYSLGPQGYSRPMPTRWGRASPSGGPGSWLLSRRCAGEGSLAAEAGPRAPQAVGEGWRACGQEPAVGMEGGAGSDELPFPSQGSEAQSGVLDFRAFQGSPLPPTSLGHRGTSARPGYSAWKVSGAHTLWGQNLWAQKPGHCRQGTPPIPP